VHFALVQGRGHECVVADCNCVPSSVDLPAKAAVMTKSTPYNLLLEPLKPSDRCAAVAGTALRPSLCTLLTLLHIAVSFGVHQVSTPKPTHKAGSDLQRNAVAQARRRGRSCAPSWRCCTSCCWSARSRRPPRCASASASRPPRYDTVVNMQI